jgi:type I restriction enzyme, R subunit
VSSAAIAPDLYSKSRWQTATLGIAAHLGEKLEKLVEGYNQVEAFFEALKALIAEMDDEERRAAHEGLTEVELAVFDLLTKPEPKLTKAQELEVKRVARDLLMSCTDGTRRA